MKTGATLLPSSYLSLPFVEYAHLKSQNNRHLLAFPLPSLSLHCPGFDRSLIRLPPMMDSSSVLPFLTKTYEMVGDRSSDDVVAWSHGNNSFVVSDLGRFQTELLPKYFKHGNFASFVRQLNTYGFRKVNSDRLEFANEAFLRGEKHLLKTISRRKHGSHPPQVQSSQAAACIEVGKLGIKEEVEILQRDKNILMQELVRLRQQQQATDHQLETVGQHMQMMEQRQQQMMSFLAKAMQSPGFLGQLVQKQSDSNRFVVARGTKKRRFSRQDELNSVGDNVNGSSNRQIVKLHPSMDEAAKAMLHQILKMNSCRRDPVMTNSGPFLLGNLPCNSLESCSSASRITEVALPDDLLSCGKSPVHVDPGFHGNLVDDDMQLAPSVVTDQLEQNHLTELNPQMCGQGESGPNFTEMPGNVTESFSGIPTAIPLGSEISNQDFINQLPSTLNMTMPEQSDPQEPDADILMDEMPILPSINDVFWEQFLTASPPPLDIDELDLITPGSNTTKDQQPMSWQDNGWDKIQRLNDLSEQMELLASASAGV